MFYSCKTFIKNTTPSSPVLHHMNTCFTRANVYGVGHRLWGRNNTHCSKI